MYGCFLNGGIPKWMVYMENQWKTLFFNGWFGGKTHHLRKYPYLDDSKKYCKTKPLLWDHSKDAAYQRRSCATSVSWGFIYHNVASVDHCPWAFQWPVFSLTSGVGQLVGGSWVQIWRLLSLRLKFGVTPKKMNPVSAILRFRVWCC